MTIQQIDHVVITTSQPEACMEFYRALGFDVKDAGGRIELIAGNFKLNVHILGRELSPHAAYVRPGSADLCFKLGGSLSQYKAALEQKGIPIELGIVSRTGAQGPMQSIYLRDPDGNLLEFCSYE